MIGLSLAEKRKLLVASRATQKNIGGPSENKYDISGLETRTTRRKKIIASKSSSVELPEQEALARDIPEELLQPTPKKAQTGMSDNANQKDLDVIALM